MKQFSTSIDMNKIIHIQLSNFPVFLDYVLLELNS